MFTSPATLTYTDVYLALDGSFMERRVVPVVSSVGVGTLTQQQGHHLKTTHRTSSLSNLKPSLVKNLPRNSLTSGVFPQCEIQAPTPTLHCCRPRHFKVQVLISHLKIKASEHFHKFSRVAAEWLLPVWAVFTHQNANHCDRAVALARLFPDKVAKCSPRKL